MARTFLPVLALALLPVGCDDGPSSAPSTPGDGGPAEPSATEQGPIAGRPLDGAGANPAVVPGAPTTDDRYTLAVEPPTSATAGQAGVVKIRVLPKGPWHINHDYPTKLTVLAPAGVELAKAEQKKSDAVTFTDEACEFAVSFTAAEAGEKAFTGELRFAICQDEACSPVREQLAFKVAVR